MDNVICNILILCLNLLLNLWTLDNLSRYIYKSMDNIHCLICYVPTLCIDLSMNLWTNILFNLQYIYSMSRSIYGQCILLNL